jgi:hypothetical protein
MCIATHNFHVTPTPYNLHTKLQFSTIYIQVDEKCTLLVSNLFNLHRSDQIFLTYHAWIRAIIPTYKPTNQRAMDRGWQHVIPRSTSNICTQNTSQSWYTQLIMDFSSWLTALTWNTDSRSESEFTRTECCGYCMWNQRLLNVKEQKTWILWQNYTGYSVNHENAISPCMDTLIVNCCRCLLLTRYTNTIATA